MTGTDFAKPLAAGALLAALLISVPMTALAAPAKAAATIKVDAKQFKVRARSPPMPPI